MTDFSFIGSVISRKVEQSELGCNVVCCTVEGTLRKPDNTLEHGVQMQLRVKPDIADCIPDSVYWYFAPETPTSMFNK